MTELVDIFMTANGTYKMKQNEENQTISELYTDDKNSKYSSNSNDILATNFYNEKFDTFQNCHL